MLYLGLEFVDVLLESDSQVCLAGIAVIVALFTFAAPRADPLIGLVAAWALLGIYVELENPENLLNMNKFRSESTLLNSSHVSESRMPSSA